MKMRLGDVVEAQAGYPFRQRIEPSTDGDVAVIQMKDIDDQSVLHTERLVNVRIPALSERYLVKQGDILFRSRGNRNGAALVGENLRPVIAAAPLMLLRVSDDRVIPAMSGGSSTILRRRLVCQIWRRAPTSRPWARPD